MFPSMPDVKSLLRYPGGKSRAIQQIAQHIPQDFTEYREPFVGGGSVFIWFKQQYPTRQFWINDLNRDVYCFGLAAQRDSERLMSEVWRIKHETHDGKKLFAKLSKQDTTIIQILSGRYGFLC